MLDRSVEVSKRLDRGNQLGQQQYEEVRMVQVQGCPIGKQQKSPEPLILLCAKTPIKGGSVGQNPGIRSKSKKPEQRYKLDLPCFDALKNASGNNIVYLLAYYG